MKLSAPIFRLKRQAKRLSRETDAPLHASLDAVAKREGYRSWSHLAGSRSQDRPAPALLARLVPGDFVLLGARPGHGKTLLGLELAAQAAQSGRRGFFFSLEENEASLAGRLRDMGFEPGEFANALTIDTSDAICADHIIECVGNRQHNSVIVVDYLQLLDQKRQNSELAVQVETLARFARTASAIVVAISQIDRAFDLEGKALPDLSNVRLPNPVDLALFTKTCFLHDGEMRLDRMN